MSIKFAEYTDAEIKQQKILQSLGEYIETNCTHGAKKPLSYQIPGENTPTIYCCLKCTVTYLMKEKIKSKIINRTPKTK